ncbi:hypothetical protein AbraCBS73388_006098 [Aspergillus brasiliensis]|uniref:Uncharacterized protein n=1 Tax=Aspergillus brasiliensis TaxID=319629 RepID=A0A9W5YR56_9EURO|nr:hypothetical protein AbraCBS73388_006098 [Aspergillus brasiliensis]
MSVSETTKHRRELLVTPLFWTASHLDAFGCSFQHVPTQAPRQSIVIQASAAVDQETNDTKVLSRSAVPSVKFHILSRFLQDNESVFNQRGHDREFIYLYEAQIPVEFLEMLDKPTIVPASTNGPIIYQRKIPFRPFETFPARVRAETLASAIVDTTSIPKNGAVK